MRSSNLVAVLLLLLVACQSQPPSMSVEEAKTLTADFPNAGFVPPPRTINDITAILDEQKPDEAYGAAVKGKLQAEPPSGGTAVTLAEFYGQRADVSMQAGLGAQALEDARRSVQLARQANSQGSLARALGRLMAAEQNTGGSGADAAYEALSMASSDGLTIQALLQLTLVSVEQGNLEAARDWVAKSDAAFAKFQQQQRPAYLVADVRANVESAHASLERNTGRYAEAERSIRSSIDDVRTWSAGYTAALGAAAGMGPERTDYRLSVRMWGLVSDLIKQGRLAEAEAVARESLIYNLRRTGRTSPQTANAIRTLASVLASQGRFRDAERLIVREIETRDALGIPASKARNDLGDLLAMQRRWQEAIASFGDSFRSLPHVMALYELDNVTDGLAIARQIHEHRSRMFGENNPEVVGARGFVAAGLALQGNDAAAREMFRSTLSQMQTTDAPIVQAYQRYSIEIYLGLLAVPTRRTPAESAESFKVADALRVAMTDRAVSASVARARLPSAELADLARREQDAQREIGAREEVLASALSRPIEQQNATALTALRADIDKLKQARAVLTWVIYMRFPDYANRVNPPPASVEQARAALTADEALVALYAGEKESYVWALRKTGDVAFAVIALRRDQLAEMVGRLRRSLDPNARTLGEIPAFDVELAYRLYAAILQPVEAGWKGAKTLITVPHGPLAQLPFALLVTRPVAPPKDLGALFSGYREVAYLVREVAVTQVPSVAALIILRGLPPGSPDRRAFVGFGDPWFSAAQATEARTEQTAMAVTRGVQFRAAPDVERRASANLAMLPRLPDTAIEVREVATTLRADPVKDVFLGPAANERTVRTLRLDDRRVVMFATHGLVPGDLDGLSQPALALTAPGVANVDGDGLLTMEKILGLKLDADWVVLSACSTAAGAGAGADAISGLGRAFFYAGARSLLVTHWPVESTSARLLTTTTFRRQVADEKLTRADALRQSMLDLLDGPGYLDPASATIAFSYAHPVFWAPFALVGDGR